MAKSMTYPFFGLLLSATIAGAAMSLSSASITLPTGEYS